MPSAIEKVLALLVQEGLLTREQADELLRAREGTSSLTDLIVSRGYADPARLSMTLLTMKALPLVCPKCRVRHLVKNLKLDGAYVCKRCGGPLEAEDVVPSGSGPIAKIEDPTPPEVLEARKDPKRVLGKYTLLRELGRGGMAVVYQAWDASLAQHVALKLIKSSDLGLPDDSKSEDVAEFLREARMAARLRHPNIVRVFEVGSHEGRHFLSMEYVEGSSLAQLARPESKGTRVPPFHAHPKRFLVLLRDTALALDHAHRNSPPIVHRDVKPQNILVDGKGRACLVDFGLAREIRGGGLLTVSGVTKGTPCYMSPEQALGRHAAIDGRTDVWGLGATLYEILSGRPPFEGPTERDILNKVIHDEPRRPSELLRAAGVVAPAQPDLETIALKCLEKEPARRYASAGEVAREIDRVLAGEAVEARAATPLGRALRWAGRRKPLVAAVGAAVLMGVVALVAILRGGGETRIVERIVVERDPASRLSAAALEIERKAVDFRFDEALRGYSELIASTQDPAEQGLLRQRLEDLRLQKTVLDGLVQRIQKAPRDYAPFRLKGSALDPARVLDATSERIILRNGGKLVEHPWGRIDPRQYVRLVKDYWPDIDGREALGFGVWCLRQGITDEAAFAFRKQSAPEAKRYLEELSVKTKELDPALEAQREKLLREAEDALAKGDTVIARARFERVLTMRPGDADAAKGLERTAEAETKPEPRPAEPEAPAPAPAPAPPPNTGPSLIPSDAGAYAEYAKQRTLFRSAMRAGDARRALELAGTPAPGGLPEIETWLAAPDVRTNLELRRVFDRRDALILERTATAVDAAIDFLAKVKAQVTATVEGKEKKGTLERSRGNVFLNESVPSGGGQGIVSWPISPSVGNRLDWLARARTLRRDKVDWRELLGDALLAAYGMGDVSGVGPVTTAAGAESPKARMDDWARLWSASATWSINLLRKEVRDRWTRQGTSVEFDSEDRLLLKPAAELVTAFDGGRLEPGLRLDVRLRVEAIEVKGAGDVRVAFLAPAAGGAWRWREAAEFDFSTNKLRFTSYPDGSSGEAAGSVTFFSSPTAWLSIRFDVGPSSITLFHEGAKVGTVPFAAPQERRLAIAAVQSRVRVDSVRLSAPTDDPVEAPSAKPSGLSGRTYQAAIQRGMEKYQAKEFRAAIEEFSGALAERPGDTYASGLRGMTYVSLKSYDAALQDYDRGLAGDAGSLRQWLLDLRGRLRQAQGDAQAALRDFDEGLALDPKSVALLRARASLSYNLRDYAKSIRDTVRAMELEPNSGSDHHHRALCLFDTGQWKAAAADFRRATELGSWSTDYAWLGLWMARARLGEQEKASAELRSYGAKAHGLEKAWFRAIVLFLTGGSTEEEFLAAASAPADAKERTDQLCEAYYYAAIKRLLAGDGAGAEPLLRKCVETGVTQFIEYVGALSELDALAGRRPTGQVAPADWSKAVGKWYYRSLSGEYNGALDVRAVAGGLLAVGWVRTDADYLWLQVGAPSGEVCRWRWVNQAGQEGESEYRLRADGSMDGTWWQGGVARKNDAFLIRPDRLSAGAAVTAPARQALQDLAARTERDVFQSDVETRRWVEEALQALGATPGPAPRAEYEFVWKDLEALGVYENRVAPDGRSCWQASRTMYGAEVLQNYVELKFEAEAGKTYRCWVQVGGCCQETLDPIAQVSELEYADPKQGGKKFSVEPGGTTAFPPKLYAGSLPKTHAQHGGVRAPTAWRWVQVELPSKYATAGTKRVRILSSSEGFAVRAAVVSTTRTSAPSANE
jgi:lipoprotein NlpI